MLLAAAVLLFSPLASQAAEKGWFGFAMAIDVAGATADGLKTAMQKSVGETLRLKIKHGADASRDVSLIAAPKPP
jgi:hypothetical protein